MTKKTSQWLIRSKKGKIKGPFSTREVMLQIKGGHLEGNESISNYPGGEWQPISHNSEFYDYLLTNLSSVEDLDDDETNWSLEGESFHSIVERTTSTEPIIPNESPDEIEDEDGEEGFPSGKTKEIRRKFEPIEAPLVLEKGKNKSKVIDKSKNYDFSKVNKTKNTYKIKEKTYKRKKNKKQKSYTLLPIIFILTAAMGLYLFFNDDQDSNNTSDVKFSYPNQKISLKPEDAKKIADMSVKYFLSDTFEGYLKAHKGFVRVLEADPSHDEDLYSLLCISYYNLWPYSKKNIQNLKIVNKLSQMAKKYDSTTLNYLNCNNVYLLLKGETGAAVKSIDRIISRYGDSSSPPTISYFLKSEILTKKQKYNEALQYISLLEELWPDWLATPFLAAITYFNLEQKDQSILRFKKILSVNSKNKKALIYVGAMRNLFFSQFEKSIQELKGALKLKERVDNNVKSAAYYYLADSFIKLDQLAESKKYIKKAYESAPTIKRNENLYISYFGGEDGDITLSAESYILQGDQFKNQGDCNAAQAYYKEAIRVDPKNVAASLKTSSCLWMLGLNNDSINILRKSLQLSPESVSLAVELSGYYIKLYKYDEAFEVLNKSHQKVRGHYELYSKFAFLELTKKNPLKAIKYADKALLKYSDHVPSYIIKANAMILMSKEKQAYAVLTKALNLDPMNVEAQTSFLKVYYKVHGIDAAVRYINKLIKKNKTEKSYRKVLGEVYLLDEQYSEAESIFKQLIEIDSNYKPAMMGLAKSYKKQGLLNESKKYYFKAAQLDATDSRPLLEVGLLYLETKNYRQAIKQFKRIQSVNPKFPKIYYYFAKANFLQKNYKEALSWIKKEKIKNPTEVDAYLLAGEIYEQQGSYQFCSKEYQQAMKFRDFGPYVYIQISRCYRKSGALDVAINILEKSRKLDSNLPDIYRELGAVYELKADFNKSRWAYENYLTLSPNAVDAVQVKQKLRSF